MKKLIRRTMGVGIVLFGFGAWAGTAIAAPAQHVPSAGDLPPIFPAEGITPDGALPASGQGVKVSGDCPAYLFVNPMGANATDAVGFAFASGNAHFYRDGSGANAEGIATLVVGDNANPVMEPYSGQTHLWFGSNSNANGQSYNGETISFHGAATDGSSITITANPGGNTSAHQKNSNGWGQLDVTCTS